MQAMGFLADLVILNLLFLITCLLLFTIGAASAALYSVTFRVGTDRDEGIFRCYLRSFRDNFRQGTALIALLAAAFGLVLALFFCCLSFTGTASLLVFLCILLLVLLALIYGYAFPLLSQFCNTVHGTLRNALLLSVGYLPRSLLITLANLLPLLVFFFAPNFFFRMGIVLISLYFSGAAYLNTQLLRKVFAPYSKNEEALS